MKNIVLAGLIVLVCSFSTQAEDKKPYLVALKSRSIMLPDVYNVELIEMEELGPRGTGDDIIYEGLMVVPYGGINYGVSRNKIRGFEGIVGVFIGKLQVSKVVSDTGMSRSQKIGNNMAHIFLGASMIKASGIDLRANLSHRRKGLTVSYSQADGASVFFLPVWTRYRVGAYGHQVNKANEKLIGENVSDEIGVDASFGAGFGYPMVLSLEAEIGVQTGKKLGAAGFATRVYGNLKVLFPLAF